MPWVRLDDRFPSHRKVAMLSDRAFRLYVSALCWSSENLTEGRVLERELPFVARLRGAKKAAAELEEANLWDGIDGGWVIHDYLEYNPDRAKVKSERASNAARQKAFRDRKKAERNARSNGVTNREESVKDDASATRRRHDGDTTEKDRRSENHRESQVTGFRNAVSNGAPSPASSTSYGSTAEKAASMHASGLPDPFAEIKKALAAAGLGAVAWDIRKHSDWQRIKTQLDRLGIELMVRVALNSSRAQGEPANVTAWIGRWQSLPDPERPGSRDSPAFDTPHCGDIDCHPDTRLRELEDDGLPVLTPCQKCHPATQGGQP